MNHKIRVSIVFLLILLVLAGCSPFGEGTEATETPTAVVLETTPSTGTPSAVATGVTVEADTPTAVIETTAAETPTAVSGATPAVCVDAAQFVSDITVPDDSQFEANTNFVKTWRIKNSGTCIWDGGYDIVHAGGHQLGAEADAFPFPATVQPGEDVQLSVDLVSPAEPGNYRGDWKFQNPQGQLFGVGQNGANPVWVRIVVKDGQPGGGSISGFAWQDADFDNEVEAGEMLAGVSIILSSGSNCGFALQTVHTDGDGRFSFNNLAPGTYCLTGTDGSVTVSEAGIELAENEQLSDLNVTWPPIWPDPASITGWVWDDANEDGMLQPDESYIAGVTVKLFGGACGGDAIPTQMITATDGEGKYSFEGLQPGVYCLFVDAAEGENETILQSGDWTFPDFGVGFHDITIQAGELVTPVNFGWGYD